MKIILLFACFVSLAVAQTSEHIWNQYTAVFKKTAEKCIKKLELPESTIHRFMTERYSPDIEPMGCLKACSLTDFKVLVNGQVSLETAYKLINHVSGKHTKLGKGLRDVSDECTQKTKHYKNVCQKALELINCWSHGLDCVVKSI